MKRMEENQVIMKIRNLTVSYDGVNKILNKVNLDICNKDFVGIIGPNGGGKTTLLKAILGLIAVDEGDIEVFGKKIKKCNGIIGYIPQYSNFDKDFPIKVGEVVLMGNLGKAEKLFHRYTKEDRELADNLMNKLGIYHLKNRQIGRISGGQMQKVLIARALAMNPQILMLDESTSSIDSVSRNQIYQILNDLNSQMTIIIVSHDIGVICSYAKKIICLNKNLYYHDHPILTNKVLDEVYGCPVELITHGDVPHRVLAKHYIEEEKET